MVHQSTRSVSRWIVGIVVAFLSAGMLPPSGAADEQTWSTFPVDQHTVVISPLAGEFLSIPQVIDRVQGASDRMSELVGRPLRPTRVLLFLPFETMGPQQEVLPRVHGRYASALDSIYISHWPALMRGDGSGRSELEDLIAHEFVHVAESSTGAIVPQWLREGAAATEMRPHPRAELETRRTLALTPALKTFDETIRMGRVSPYTGGRLAIGFLSSYCGQELGWPTLFVETGKGLPLGRLLRGQCGIDETSLVKLWIGSIETGAADDQTAPRPLGPATTSTKLMPGETVLDVCSIGEAIWMLLGTQAGTRIDHVEDHRRVRIDVDQPFAMACRGPSLVALDDHGRSYRVRAESGTMDVEDGPRVPIPRSALSWAPDEDCGLYWGKVGEDTRLICLSASLVYRTLPIESPAGGRIMEGPCAKDSYVLSRPDGTVRRIAVSGGTADESLLAVGRLIGAIRGQAWLAVDESRLLPLRGAVSSIDLKGMQIISSPPDVFLVSWSDGRQEIHSFNLLASSLHAGWGSLASCELHRPARRIHHGGSLDDTRSTRGRVPLGALPRGGAVAGREDVRLARPVGQLHRVAPEGHARRVARRAA